MLVVGCWLFVVRCWLFVVCYWLLVIGCWLLVIGYWLLFIGCLFSRPLTSSACPHSSLSIFFRGWSKNNKQQTTNN
ncbi:MAG TPA: hypothetical protein DEG47_09550, partial [Cyanobacteria bacterium UBA11148]|nr:hypothetical protein [Cyanobacteria bacterium UBA11148]